MTDLVSSLQFGIPSAVIVLIFLIISKIIDSLNERHKDKTKVEVNKEMIDCFNNLNSFLQHITKDIVEKDNDKCSATIRTAFKSMSYALIRFATFTIINNNIKTNKENIEENINNVVDKEYATLYNTLVLYYSDKNQIVDNLKEEWKDDLKKDLRNIIFNTSLDKDTRLYNVHNKIDIKIDRYYTYINNKFLENE